MIGISVSLCCLSCDSLQPEKRLSSLPKIALNIKGRPFVLWLAVKPSEQQLGLKGVSTDALRAGPQDVGRGMMFIYPESCVLSFSMVDVPVPLDLLFISRDGILLHAETMRVNSEKTYPGRSRPSMLWSWSKGLLRRWICGPEIGLLQRSG